MLLQANWSNSIISTVTRSWTLSVENPQDTWEKSKKHTNKKKNTVYNVS